MGVGWSYYGISKIHISLTLITQVVEPVETPFLYSRPFDGLKGLSFLLV